MRRLILVHMTLGDVLSFSSNLSYVSAPYAVTASTSVASTTGSAFLGGYL